MNGHCNSFCSTVALDLSLGILLYITEFILFTFRSKGRHNCFSDYLFPKKTNKQSLQYLSLFCSELVFSMTSTNFYQDVGCRLLKAQSVIEKIKHSGTLTLLICVNQSGGALGVLYINPPSFLHPSLFII